MTWLPLPTFRISTSSYFRRQKSGGDAQAKAQVYQHGATNYHTVSVALLRGDDLTNDE